MLYKNQHFGEQTCKRPEGGSCAWSSSHPAPHPYGATACHPLKVRLKPGEISLSLK
jgi:hypothetical protein